MTIISKNIENLKPNKEYIVTVRAKNNDINVMSEYTDSVRFVTPTDATIPNAPTNLVLAASFLNVLFQYTDSIDEDTAKYEYELYKEDQVQLISAQYQVISGETPHRTGYVQTNVFVVSVDDNSTTTSTSSTTNPVKYYGRVRTIDTAGNISGWTSIVASGDTPLIDEEFIGSLTAAKITAGTIGAHEIILTQPGTTYSYTPPANMAVIRTSNYQSGSTGWLIRGDGQAEFNNATIRGELLAGAFSINSNNYWNSSTIKTYGDYSDFRVGDSTRYILWDNSAGTLQVTGTINAVGGTFSGSITASGTISGGTISGATITSSDSKLTLASNAFNNGIASGTVASLKIINTAAEADTSSITPGIYLQDPSNSAIFSKITGNSWLGEYYLNIHSPRTNSGSTLDYSDIRLSSTGIFQNFRDVNANKWTNIELASGEIRIRASNSSSSLYNGIFLTESYFSIFPSSYTSFMQENNGTSSGYLRIPCDGSNTAITTFAKAATSYHITFHNTSNAAIGTIRTDNSNTYYDNYSDYRLKENISTINQACNILQNLNPVYFNYKNDPKQKVMGFIAHEVQEIFPYLVGSEKDAIKEDGSPNYQTLDYSKFTPIITAAVKEIIERLEILENK
jgi:hypothetical protein